LRVTGEEIIPKHRLRGVKIADELGAGDRDRRTEIDDSFDAPEISDTA
jgi:hypothetical protein